MELLDQQQVAFVAATQQFDTSAPMGRLTLHLLLTFAQFERELIVERTKDKMSAMRRKGRWLGSTPPLFSPAMEKVRINALCSDTQSFARRHLVSGIQYHHAAVTVHGS